MKRERRNFTEEFKREAVRLVSQPGATKTGIARDLGRPQFAWSMVPRRRRHWQLQGRRNREGDPGKREVENQGLLRSIRISHEATSEDFQNLLETHGIVCSMSRRGNCWDNAAMESFFSTQTLNTGLRQPGTIRSPNT
jgi:transposase InsO family protein